VGVATRTFAPVAAPAALGGRRRLRALGDLTEFTVSVVPTPANVRGRLPRRRACGPAWEHALSITPPRPCTCEVERRVSAPQGRWLS